jgi:hypothetical protein
MSTMQQAYPRVLDAVQELRRGWRFQRVAEGALLALAGSAGALVLLVGLDNLLTPLGWPLGLAGRALAALALWAVVLGGAFAWVVKRVLEDRRDDYFAALAEERYPELGNRLINALQLGRGNQDGHSPRLIEAIVAGAAERLDDLELDKSIAGPGRRRRRRCPGRAARLQRRLQRAFPQRGGPPAAAVG